MSDQSTNGAERNTKCPNCGIEGRENYGLEGLPYEEWDCDNGNCGVSLYKVRSIDTDIEQ